MREIRTRITPNTDTFYAVNKTPTKLSAQTLTSTHPSKSKE